MPFKQPALGGGVAICPFLTTNRLSPVASATLPCALSISPSPAPTRFASILARMLLMYLPVHLMRGSMASGEGTRVAQVTIVSPCS
jgi:hypothetical protein